MKYIKKLWVRVTAAIVVGLLLAYAGACVTHVTRPCTPAEAPRGEAISRCQTVEKVFVHPGDLLTNKQGRLVHFSETFVVVSLASFALLSVFGLVQKKNT